MGAFSSLLGKATGFIESRTPNSKIGIEDIIEVLYIDVTHIYGIEHSFCGPYWVNKAFIGNKDYIIPSIGIKVKSIDDLRLMLKSMDYTREYFRSSSFGTVTPISSASGIDTGLVVNSKFGDVVLTIDLYNPLDESDLFNISGSNIQGMTPTVSLADLFVGALLNKDNYFYAKLFYDMTKCGKYGFNIKQFNCIVKDRIPSIDTLDSKEVLLSGNLRSKLEEVGDMSLPDILDRFATYINVVVDDEDVLWDSKCERWVEKRK